MAPSGSAAPLLRNTGVKDWRAQGIDVVCVPIVDQHSTKEWAGFLEKSDVKRYYSFHTERKASWHFEVSKFYDRNHILTLLSNSQNMVQSVIMRNAAILW